MVVAVVAVRVVQVALDQVVGVVAVRDGLMTTAGAVPMGLVVLAAVVRGSAGRRVGGADVDLVFLDPRWRRVVQAAVVQIIDMTVVLDRGVAAVGPVRVRVSSMVGAHRLFSFLA